jgi:hypothetical protein
MVRAGESLVTCKTLFHNNNKITLDTSNVAKSDGVESAVESAVSTPGRRNLTEGVTLCAQAMSQPMHACLRCCSEHTHQVDLIVELGDEMTRCVFAT